MNNKKKSPQKRIDIEAILRPPKVSPLRHRRARAQVMVKFNSIQ